MYIKFVELESLECCMPSFKIIGLPVLEEKILKVFTIYVRGGHLGHVTKTMFIN